MKKTIIFTIVISVVLNFVTRADAPYNSIHFVKYSEIVVFIPPWQNYFNRLLAKYHSDQTIQINNIPFNDIPTVITKAKMVNKSAPIALLISGDGGWYGFEQSIANHLADYGIPTVGLDSRKYFWKRKTPGETAKDIEAVLDYYSKEWSQTRFLLIGYSLGAEIVPFIVTRLTEEMKLKVVSAVLLSPEITTDFEIHVSNMLGMGNRQNTYNVKDEILKMQSVPTLCIFGESEKSPYPDILAGTTVKVVLLPGDHHYKSNLPLIVKTMKDNKAF